MESGPPPGSATAGAKPRDGSTDPPRSPSLRRPRRAGTRLARLIVPALAGADIDQVQPEDLAAAQPAEQHRLDHRLVPVGPQRTDERVSLVGVDHSRQGARRPD